MLTSYVYVLFLIILSLKDFITIQGYSMLPNAFSSIDIVML